MTDETNTLPATAESIQVTAPADTAARTSLAVLLGDPAMIDNVNRVDTDKLGMLLNYQQHELDRGAERLYTKAFIECQRAIPPVLKQGRNQHTDSYYAFVEHVQRVVEPVMYAHGFGYSTDFGGRDGAEREVVMTLRHIGGHVTRHSFWAEPDAKGAKGGGNKTGLQAGASLLTTGTRQLLCNVWGIVTTRDNDGNIDAPAETVTEEQAATLQSMAGDAQVDDEFFDAMQKRTGVRAFKQVPRANYVDVVQALQRRTAKLVEGNANG